MPIETSAVICMGDPSPEPIHPNTLYTCRLLDTEVTTDFCSKLICYTWTWERI